MPLQKELKKANEFMSDECNGRIRKEADKFKNVKKNEVSQSVLQFCVTNKMASGFSPLVQHVVKDM